ncbi:hypothetical protein [Undibacterium terreum]|uniref:Uncharacterized protein n=1 Tax=Undibacterium terreum TaxID=1224302 RepID=A0A916U7A0_9BURK|nr:hypothetical protein [Undibacterium terreum]GGC62376.1 hypothetical protein GCM10011396_06610 [Undibacterium terreum]
MIFGKKDVKPAPAGKKKILRDVRNYHVTQFSTDQAKAEKGKLEAGMQVGGQVLSYKDGVLSIQGGTKAGSKKT